MTVERPWLPRHIAVPPSDETVLAVPEPGAAADTARANAELLAASEIDVQGRTLARLRFEARRDVIRLAKAFTSDVLGDPKAEADASAALVVPGHQPALYHPGVWAKNFASAGIARRAGGSALNLIVDNDIFTRPAIDAPAGSREQPTRSVLAFDAGQPARPWEEARVKDGALFRSFGERVRRHMQTWKIEPLIGGGWQRAVERFTFGGSIPECLSAVRHGFETDWGIHNLELPLSRLCETDAFLRFAAHLIAHLSRFQSVYNTALAEYQRLYGLKSRNHPVPSLEARDGWLEAPFWAWRDDLPQRKRVFAKQEGKETLLADDSGRVFATLPLSPEMDACCAVEVMRSLPAKGIRFRTRALTTTLFARLFLADVFVHGIGGAKYDEMTDRIMARFFKIPAPEFATVSASAFLPFAEPFDATREDERRLVGLLRDLTQNPQRHLSRGMEAGIDRLLDEKAELVAEQEADSAVRSLTHRQRRQRSAANGRRFRRLQQVTAELTKFAAVQREAVARELAQTRRRLSANCILASREFSFALYPEEKLRPFLLRLANG